jgi:hypothetical protein
MDKYSEKANLLQMQVKMHESQQHITYSTDDVNQAVVHIREDVVVIVSLLQSLNMQVNQIKNIILIFSVAIVALSIFIYLK